MERLRAVVLSRAGARRTFDFVGASLPDIRVWSSLKKGSARTMCNVFWIDGHKPGALFTMAAGLARHVLDQKDRYFDFMPAAVTERAVTAAPAVLACGG